MFSENEIQQYIEQINQLNNQINQLNEKINNNKATTYTQAHRRAQQKYREKNRAQYNELQRNLYEKRKQDEDWKKKFNERSRENNKIYRLKKKEEKMSNPDYQPKKRGRPRKE
jgi:hypothetical protein